MFNARSKIIKKDHSQITEVEDEAAKCLMNLELNNASLKDQLSQIYISSAQLVEYTQ